MKNIHCVWLLLLVITNVYAGRVELPSYYPQDFVSHVERASLRGQSLKTEIKKIISRLHVKSKGQRDQVVDSCPSNSTCIGHTSLGYNTARKYLFGEIHLEQDGQGEFVRDVYCGKILRSQVGVGHHRIPDANVINCEHTWPQSKFTPSHSRDMQKSDLHHLYPTDNPANSTRGNHPFAEVEGNNLGRDCEESFIGGLEGQGGGTYFEPPSDHKGNVARAIFYFSIRYDMEMPSEQAQALKRWNELDPVDSDELRRNEIIEKYQGNRNPFIDAPTLINLL